jgi:hypothetical protein
MSVYAGPEFNESGLVYYHDMNNKKSYVGAPTTNYVTNADTMPSWSTYGGTPVAFQTEFNTTGYRMTNAPSWNGIYKGVSVPSNGVYTFSIWARYLGGSPNNNGGGVYISGWGGGDSASVTNRTQIGQWQRLSVTLNCTTTSMTFYCISYGGTNDGNSDRSSWEVTMPQVEPGSVATNWVNGSRSSTQVLRDLTGGNTITATSLTYNANNTFSFNGSSNFMNCGNSSSLAALTGTTSVTVEAWINLSGYGSSGYGVIAHKGANWAFLMENPSNTMRIRFGLSVSGDVACPDSTTHALNTWYHFVGTYDGSNMRFYRNGALTNTVAASGTLGGSGSDMVIGSYSGAYFSQGQVPMLKVYNRTLSAAEIFSNYTASRLRYGI